MHWLTKGAADAGGERETTFFPSSIEQVEAVFAVDIEVPDECNVAVAKELTTGTICPGYFLQIEAVKNFPVKHGGESIPVMPGIDNKSHLNLLTSFATEDIPQHVPDSPPIHGGDDSGGSGGGDHTGGGGH